MNLSEITLPKRPRTLRFEVQAFAGASFEVRADASTPTIRIFDTIREGFTAKVAAALEAIGPKPVLIEINSNGGDFFEAVGAYNLLVRHGRDHRVTAQVMGIAASAASVIAMAAVQIDIYQAARFMIHNSQGVAIGNAKDLRAVSDILKTLDATMRSIYAARTGHDPGEIGRMMDQESFIDSAQAVELGFADRVVDQAAVPIPVALRAAAPQDKIAVEQSLRQAGFSRSAAMRMASAWQPRHDHGGGVDAGLAAAISNFEQLTDIFSKGS